MSDENRNYNITGHLDLPGFSATFPIASEGIERSLTLALINAAGYGDGGFAEQRPNGATGAVVCMGLESIDQFVLPDQFIGLIGTLKISHDDDGTRLETMSVRVTGYSTSRSQKTNNNYHLKISCLITDMPVLTGWGGTQAALTSETFAAKELWSGLRITVDPAPVDLGSSAGQRILLWATVALSSGEIAGIQTQIATATDPTGLSLKLRPAGFTRSGEFACHLDYAWAKNNTNDDVLNPQTVRMVDPNALTSYEKTTALNTTPGGGSIAGLVSRGITYIKHNDGAIQQVKDWGPRSTIQDITFPGTFTNDDPSDLGDTKEITQVESSGTPTPPSTPSGYKLRNTHSEQHTDAGKWIHRYTYGRRNPAEDVTMGGSYTVDDPTDLGDEQVVVAIQSSATSSPSVPSGYSHYSTVATQMHGASSGDKWRVTYTYKRLNRIEEIEHGETVARRQYFSPSSGTVYTQAQIKTCTGSDTVETLLVTEVATLEAVTGRPYFSVQVRKLNKILYELSIDRPNDDKHVRTGGVSLRYESKTLDPTNVYLKTQRVSEYGSGQFIFKLGTWSILVHRQSIILRRYIRDDHAADIRQTSLYGTRNNAAFLGYPSTTVYYQGMETAFSWATDGNNTWFAVDYIYEHCATQWLGSLYDGNYECSFVVTDDWLVTDESVTEGGAILAADISSAWVATTGTSASYSGFLT